jgi:hypothetical protein
VLADYHHSDLFESLTMLFHDRFGYDFYRPIGLSWFTEGYWQFEKAYHGDAVAKQYLGRWDGDRDCGDHWERDDTTHPGRVYQMVTLEQARSQSWDIVLASVPENEEGLHEFARSVGAKFGIQVGNQWSYNAWDLADFGLVSSTLPYACPKPHVFYRQEFSLVDFRYEYPPAERNSIGSFIQCFPESAVPYQEFLDLARAAPEFDWKVYGAYGSHPLDEYACGNLSPTPAVAEGMRRTRTIWHSKSWSDGYGHVIHNAFAVGRPVVGRARYYADKMAGPLWVEGVTSFDMDAHSPAELLTILRRLRDDDDYHRTICEAATARFREVVSFDEDAEKIRAMLATVL